MYYSLQKKLMLSFFDKFLNGILGFVAKSLNDGPQFIRPENFKSENFYRGTEKFINQPPENGKWSLGYSSISLSPGDYKNHDYYLGGYFSPDNGFCNKIENVIDDMKARVIAIDDGSGRGMNIFAVVDCIGITNSNIRKIRQAFISKYSALNPDAFFASVNVCSTHTHSCVDTEGLWTGGLDKIKKNFKLNRKKQTPEQGVDEKYLEFLIDSVSETMVSACGNMSTGSMTVAVKDIGKEYFSNKNRPSATALDTNLTRLIFTPDDKNETPTVIAMMAAHPDVAGLPTRDKSGSGRDLSGDYIYYFGEFLSSQGYNLMFFNGAICAIYMARSVTNDNLNFEHRYEQSARYGRELAKITLSLTKTKKEIEKDDSLSEKEKTKSEMEESQKNGGGYTLWYENWEPVSEKNVSPYFNIRLSQVKVQVLNPVIQIVGKLNLADFKVISEGKNKFSLYTEIGYLEIGNSVKAVMVPGEFCADLLKGGASLTADGSFSGKAFSCLPLCELFGKDVIALGLANDEIGYIVPDNDYVLSDFKNHYHEEISVGVHTASAIIKGFEKLKENICEDEKNA